MEKIMVTKVSKPDRYNDLFVDTYCCEIGRKIKFSVIQRLQSGTTLSRPWPFIQYAIKCEACLN